MPWVDHHRPRPARQLSPVRRRRTPRVVFGAAAREEGFSVIESTIALGVVFAVLIGLTASLTTGIKGVLTGRQRSAAVAVAKAVVEEARAASFRDLGHDVVGDTTLATDTALAGATPDYTYTPLNGSGAEELVGAVNPQFPTHQWSETRDGNTYDITVYVTWVRLTTGDDYKRLTVFVSYDNAQYDTATISNIVGLSTYVSVGGQSPIEYLTIPKQPPPGASTTTTAPGGSTTTTTACPGCPGVPPYVDADADAGAGKATVTGTIAGLDISHANLFFPMSRGDLAGRFSREVHGVGQGSWGELTLLSGEPVGGTVDDTTAVCSPARATTVADNDNQLPAPIQDVDPDSGGYDTSGTCTVRSPLGLLDSLVVNSGTGKARSQSSADSCLLCAPAVGDGDHLMYGFDEGAGDAAGSIAFTAGILSGLLVDDAKLSTNATVDQDQGPLVTSTAQSSSDPLTIFDLSSLAPSGFVGAVQAPATNVSATAQAGPTAGAPSVSGGPYTLKVWSDDGGLLGTGGYVDVVVVPGQASETVNEASFTAIDLLGVEAGVTIETTVRTAAATTTCDGGAPPCSTPVNQAEASIDGWLQITVRVTAVQAGVTTLDLTVDVDYGDVKSVAEYQA